MHIFCWFPEEESGKYSRISASYLSLGYTHICCSRYNDEDHSQSASRTLNKILLSRSHKNQPQIFPLDNLGKITTDVRTAQEVKKGSCEKKV